MFQPWTTTVPDLWQLDERSLRIVCDHLRSSVVVIGDGVRPSNTRRGYVLRRLVRRVLTRLWRTDPGWTLGDLPTGPIEHTLQHFRLGMEVSPVREVLLTEENRFRELVRQGRTLVSRQRSRGPLGDEQYRFLYDTHGLPRELVDDLLDEPVT